jgi:hypothetical protein
VGAEEDEGELGSSSVEARAAVSAEAAGTELEKATSRLITSVGRSNKTTEAELIESVATGEGAPVIGFSPTNFFSSSSLMT